MAAQQYWEAVLFRRLGEILDEPVAYRDPRSEEAGWALHPMTSAAESCKVRNRPKYFLERAHRECPGQSAVGRQNRRWLAPI
jgi:hypothetical protein